MPIVVNSNASATSASFNLSRANDSLRKSLERLSSGKRINNAAGYLRGDLWHAEVCGVDADYVKRVIKEEGLCG